MGRVYKALVKAGKWEGVKAVDARQEPQKTAFGPISLVAAATRPTFQKTLCKEPSQLINVTEVTVDRRLAAFWGSDPLAKDRYQALAVRVSHLALQRRMKSLLVTSALEGEGKSTVALNLAWTLAKPGERRVLFVEANLRSPSLGRMLGISPRRSWSAIVDGNGDFASTSIRLDPRRLYLLPTCQADFLTRRNGKAAEPAELLTSQGTEELIADLEDQFDLVVIDAPAISKFAETQRLAAITGGTIFVVRAGTTPHTIVDAGIKLVPKERRLGVVLNQADEEGQR